jgi:signal transduction histidine kinase
MRGPASSLSLALHSGAPPLIAAWLTLALVVAAPWPTSAGEATPAGPRTLNVLLLHAVARVNPAQLALDEGFRATLTAKAGAPVYFYTEYLDLTLFPGEELVPELRMLLRRKYRGVPLDLLVVTTTRGLRLAMRYRAELFPGVPIVFGGVDKDAAAAIALPGDVTGLWLALSWAGTLEAALRLQPDTRRVVVVTGAGPIDRIWNAAARVQLEPYRDRLEITWLTDGALDEVRRHLGSATKGTVVLFGSYSRDARGQNTFATEVFGRVAPTATVPIYAIAEPLMGLGTVGGHLTSFERLGMQMADLALRVVRGERPPPTDGLSGIHIFDWRQLRRWGLDERRLPPGAVIRFREPSIWELYRWYIVGAVGGLITQSALIAALVVSRARRRRAEADARRHRDELSHVLRIATLGELTASLAHEINQPLAAIVANAQAARRLIGAAVIERASVRAALTDIADDAKRASEVIRRLRALFRREQPRYSAVQLDAVVANVVNVLRRDIDERGILVRVELDPGLPPVLGDHIQLQQVLLNVVLNACEAVAPDDPGAGTLTIAATHSELGRVAITIHDRGVAVEENELEKIFEHFVSTKAEGLGMGLAISRSIVEAHGGRIWATRNPDRGLTQHIELPCAS